jgi:flagellar basal body-associated protein FliL
MTRLIIIIIIIIVIIVVVVVVVVLVLLLTFSARLNISCWHSDMSVNLTLGDQNFYQNEGAYYIHTFTVNIT